MMKIKRTNSKTTRPSEPGNHQNCPSGCKCFKAQLGELPLVEGGGAKHSPPGPYGENMMKITKNHNF